MGVLCVAILRAAEVCKCAHCLQRAVQCSEPTMRSRRPSTRSLSAHRSDPLAASAPSHRRLECSYLHVLNLSDSLPRLVVALPPENAVVSARTAEQQLPCAWIQHRPTYALAKVNVLHFSLPEQSRDMFPQRALFTHDGSVFPYLLYKCRACLLRCTSIAVRVYVPALLFRNNGAHQKP